MEPWPPALLLFDRERKEERKREKFYIGTSTLVRTTAQPTLALDDTHNDSPFFFLAVWELIYHKTYHMSYSQDMARGKIDHVGQNTCPTDVQSNPAWALT